MIVAIYARVSTTDQSCEMQLHELRQYAGRQGFQVFTEYVDTGFSGAASSRPQLDRLLRDARFRRFEAVLVWKLDRWGQRGALRSHYPGSCGLGNPLPEPERGH